jgi:hypothetical protein
MLQMNAQDILLFVVLGVNIVTEAVQRPILGPQFQQAYPNPNIPFQHTQQPPPSFPTGQNAYNFGRVPFPGSGPIPVNHNYVKEGYLQPPDYENQPKLPPWCAFPYHCGNGQLCPQQPICPAQRHCCRSLMGMCCFTPSDRSPPQYPPPMPPSRPFISEPKLPHYPLPEHRITVHPPENYTPVIHRPPPPQAHPYSPMISHPPPLHLNGYMPNTTPARGPFNNPY